MSLAGVVFPPGSEGAGLAARYPRLAGLRRCRKEARRLATRHETLAFNDLAVAQVAVIARHLRRLAPSDRA